MRVWHVLHSIFFVKIFVQNYVLILYDYYIYVPHVKYLYIFTFSHSFTLCPMFYNLLGPSLSTTIKLKTLKKFYVCGDRISLWIGAQLDYSKSSHEDNANHLSLSLGNNENHLSLSLGDNVYL